MNKIISKDLEILKQEFLVNFLNSLKSIRNNEKIVIWLSGWNSLKSFYGVIKDNFGFIEKEIRDKIYFCFLDERIVDFDHEDSNYKLVKSLFLDYLLKQEYITKDQILLPNFQNSDFLDDYTRKVWVINIWLFWVWEDWHIASLFPNHNLLDNNSNNFLEITNSPKPPPRRITISKKYIENMDFWFVFFMWNWKKDAFNNFLDNTNDYKKTPCKLILNSKNTFVISDLEN